MKPGSTNESLIWGVLVGMALVRGERITTKWLEIEFGVTYTTASRYIKRIAASPLVPASRHRERRSYGRAAFVLELDKG